MEHVSRQPPSQSSEEPTELEIRQVQEPAGHRKKGYGESFIVLMAWLILWLIKNAILVLVILLLLEYVIGPKFAEWLSSSLGGTLG